MSPETYAHVSNLLIPTATVIYALAMVSHAMEWALGRAAVSSKVAAKEEVLVGSGGETVAPAAPAEEPSTERLDAASRIGLLLTWLGFVFHLGGVVTRGLAAGRVPWGNMYEFSITASLAVAIVYLIFVQRYKLQWLGLGVTLVVAAVLGLATLALYTPAGPLVPALHSYWLVIHVLGAMIAGAAFLVGAAASVLYLVKSKAEATTSEDERTGFLWRIPPSAAIDQVAYRVHAFAFPIWTFAALIAGPIWAQYAWGRYWGWDPKEVWAFITWVVYAGYLHARATAGWKGKAAAILALVGFATFVFNFTGVNLFVGGMHSYAK